MQTGEARSLRIGEVLGDCYEITGLLGCGGMAEVYSALDRMLNRRVAIKVSRPSLDPAILVREARYLAGFRHPGLPLIHAMGRHRGIDYVVMEHLSGRSLAEYLYRDEHIFDVDQACDLLLRVAETLDIIHNATLAHRDLKPSNIMLVPADRAVLLDFGVADLECHISDDNIAGSNHYIAPEIATATATPGRAHLADIYALGVIGFRMLAGYTPFQGRTLREVVSRQMFDPVPSLQDARPEVPVALSRLISEMLSREPDERPQMASLVAGRLRSILRRMRRPRTRRVTTGSFAVVERVTARIDSPHRDAGSGPLEPPSTSR